MVANATAPRRENVPRHILFYGGRMKSDTIAAIATALSDAGIGIIRISGPEAVSYTQLCNSENWIIPAI